MIHVRPQPFEVGETEVKLGDLPQTTQPTGVDARLVLCMQYEGL